MPDITITASAAAKINSFAQDKNSQTGGVRLGVKGGGCSGLAYVFDWADAPRDIEEVIEHDGARVFLDKKSKLFLKGLTLDYKETLAQSGFVFVNPNVKSSCGCGESFTV